MSARIGLLWAVTYCIASHAMADTTGTLLVPGHFATIQDAIEQAADGEEVVVAPGTYNEALSFMGRAITVRSESGPGVTIVDATGLDASVVAFRNGEQPNSVLQGFTLQGGTGTPTMGSTYGGGIYARMAHPTIRNCVIRNNTAGGGGGISLYMAWATVENCRIEDNTATVGGSAGGGGIHLFASNATVKNCSIRQNLADIAAVGGGATLTNSSPKFTNCVFAGNEGWAGGAIFNNSGDPVLTNCTVVGNHSRTNDNGGAIYSGGNNAAPVVLNCILWDNTAGSAPNMVRQDWGSQASISYCILQEDWSGPGLYNRQTEPGFVNAGSGDYHLAGNSPAIDAGSREGYPAGVDSDVEGNPRFLDAPAVTDTGAGPAPMVDIGAFEFQALCREDTTGDGLVNIFDLLVLLDAWGTSGPGAGIAEPTDNADIFDLLALLDAWGMCPE